MEERLNVISRGVNLGTGFCRWESFGTKGKLTLQFGTWVDLHEVLSASESLNDEWLPTDLMLAQGHQLDSVEWSWNCLIYAANPGGGGEHWTIGLTVFDQLVTLQSISRYELSINLTYIMLSTSRWFFFLLGGGGATYTDVCVSKLLRVLPLHLESPLVEALCSEGARDGWGTWCEVDWVGLLWDDLTHSEWSSPAHFVRARMCLYKQWQFVN